MDLNDASWSLKTHPPKEKFDKFLVPFYFLGILV